MNTNLCPGSANPSQLGSAIDMLTDISLSNRDRVPDDDELASGTSKTQQEAKLFVDF